MKATIYSVGDESVGIPSVESYVELGFDFQDKDDRESVRGVLKDCFNEIHDNGTTTVMFEDEEKEFQELEAEICGGDKKW